MYESPPIVKKKYGGFLIVVSNICHGQFLLKEVLFDTHSRNLNPRNIGISTFTNQDRRSPTTALPMFSEGLLQSRISTSDLSFMSGIEMCSVHHVSTCCQQLCSALKALKSKCQSLSQSVSQWVTMSPIMLAWKAKKTSRKGQTWLLLSAGYGLPWPPPPIRTFLRKSARGCEAHAGHKWSGQGDFLKFQKCHLTNDFQGILASAPEKPTPPRKPRSVKAQKTAAKVQLMKLKMKSKAGNNGLPQEERVYLLVSLPKALQKQPQGTWVGNKK